MVVNADGDKERLPPSLAGSSSLVDHSGTHKHAEHSGTGLSECEESPSIEEKETNTGLNLQKQTSFKNSLKAALMNIFILSEKLTLSVYSGRESSPDSAALRSVLASFSLLFWRTDRVGDQLVSIVQHLAAEEHNIFLWS